MRGTNNSSEISTRDGMLQDVDVLTVASTMCSYLLLLLYIRLLLLLLL
jgi:hypothetical protein